MDYFTPLEGANAITINRGVYRQVALYLRGDVIYARSGNGFVKLMAHGITSSPSAKWIEVDPGEDGMHSDDKGLLRYRPNLSMVSK